ncbi:MAG: SOS response-associated peptidase [Pseudomonadota bacterium]
MCGRFALTLPIDAMAQLFEAVPANDLPELPNYNICPTNQVCTILAGENRRLIQMRWGFIPHWYKKPNDGPLLINARSETIAEKPAFRAACRQRRCLIPATGFYEWTKDDNGKRLPWYIRSTDGSPLAFAGVWQMWERDGQSLATCAIVTTAAGPATQAIHHRVPVVVCPPDWPLWLGEAGEGAARLMTPLEDTALAFHRVGTDVNSNRASGPELIEAI